jgi:hypothetical protein
MKAWVIDRDYINDPDDDVFDVPSRVGCGATESDCAATMETFANQVFVSFDMKASEVEDPIRFRALDDDGEVYYGGACTREFLLGEHDYTYTILKFVEADAGAVDVQFRADDLPERIVEQHRGFNCVVNDGGTEWVIIYG